MTVGWHIQKQKSPPSNSSSAPLGKTLAQKLVLCTHPPSAGFIHLKRLCCCGYISIYYFSSSLFSLFLSLLEATTHRLSPFIPYVCTEMEWKWEYIIEEGDVVLMLALLSFSFRSSCRLLCLVCSVLCTNPNYISDEALIKSSIL